jgi:hypothetical protein
MTGEQRREAGRTVWRLLKQQDGWVDEVFIGWPHLPQDVLREGLNELGARGLIESRYDTKRVQVRLLTHPKPTQQAMEF